MCGEAATGGVEVIGSDRDADLLPGEDGASDGHLYEYTEVPTCSTNAIGGDHILCPAATSSCPAGVRVWVFRRELDPVTRLPLSQWVSLGVACRILAAPTPAQIQTALLIDRRYLPAPVSHTRIDPRSGRTVVNARVVYSADTPRWHTATVTVVGIRVSLRFVPREWRWSFGDGSTLRTSSPGAPYPATTITHRYRSTGRYLPFVTVTWDVAFSYAGGSGSITGVDVVGPPTAVNVGQARAQLVDEPAA